MLLPGPEATQLATYLGWLMHGWLGGVIAGVLFLLPSALLLSLLAWLYALWGAMRHVGPHRYGMSLPHSQRVSSCCRRCQSTLV